jgi:two-component system response regulator NreC
MNTTILLVDDHKIVREGFRSLLEKQPGFQVVGEADNGRTAVQITRDLKPHIVIMDVSLPRISGIEATRQIVDEMPDVRVIALSIHSENTFVVEMLRAGAKAYLIKDCAFDELIQAIEVVMSNRVYLSPMITDGVVHSYLDYMKKVEAPSFPSLTPREREILKHLAEGKTLKLIASNLGVSVKTIEAHRRNIMEKLGITTTIDLVKYAIREGLIVLDE